MIFGALLSLWFLLLIPIVGGFLVWSFRKKTWLIEQFVSPALKQRLMQGVSPKRQRLKAGILLLVMAFMIVAMARPKYGFHWEEVESRGVDIIIALDVSGSMLAQDVSPSRLERAKHEILDLLALTHGDRIGLLAFAGVAFLQCPLTLDYGAVKMFLDDIDPSLIPVPGTAIAEAIDKAVDAFDKHDNKARVVILITDGEDHMGSTLEAATRAKEKGVKIYTIGIGKETGAPIPDEQKGGFKKDRNGEVVMSKVDEESLQRVALTTGGSYVHAVSGGLELEKIYEDIVKTVGDKELKSGMRKRYEERFQWPLLVALLLLVFEALLSERTASSRRRFYLPKFWRNLRKPMILMLCCYPLLHGGRADAAVFGGKEQDGINAYDKKDYATALRELLDAQIEKPDDQNLKYNLANTYYKSGDYKNAEALYRDIAQGDGPLAAKATYNLGNTAYRAGKLEDAVAYYERATQLDPADEDAKANLSFVREEIRRRLEEMKKQQQNQPQNGQQKPGQQNQQPQNGQQKPEPQNQQPPNGQPKPEPQKPSGAEQKQDNKAGQNADQQKQPDKAGKPGEAAAGGKSDEQKAKEQQAAAARAARGGEPKDGEMKEQDAVQLLDSYKSNRKDFTKKKLEGQQGQSNYQIEKDW